MSDLPRRRTWILLLIALAARLFLQGWDSGLLSPHPDERQVAFVAERFSSWFSDPDFYAYGSLHFNLVRLMASIGGLPKTYAGLLVAGRTLSLVASLISLLLAWSLARQAWGERSAEILLLVGALVPLDLQQSHFATVEAHHALWIMAALMAAYAAAWHGRLPAAIIAGATFGASVAVKVASLPLAASLTVAALASFSRHGPRTAFRQALFALATALAAFWLGQPSAFVAQQPPWLAITFLICSGGLLSLPARFLQHRRFTNVIATVVGIAAIVALLAGQFGILATGAGGSQFGDPYLHGVGEQLAMVSGKTDLPYVRVYEPTKAFLYPAHQLTIFGLGPALALAALAAIVAAGRRLIFRLRSPHRRWHDRSHLLLALLLAWVIPVSLRLATLEVKFLRYWQPLVLPLALLAAWWLARIGRPFRRATVAVVGTAALLAGITFVWAFAAPHPHRQAASWLEPLLEPGTTVAFEHWDEGLPLPGLGRGARTLTSYDLPEDEAKIRRLATTLSEVDWVVLTSHRVRRTVAANPNRFPRTGRIYEELLAGRAGFEVAGVAERGPRLFDLKMPVQQADESFVNYDFPRVVLLHRVGVTDINALTATSADGLPPDFDHLESLISDAPRLPFTPKAKNQATALVSWLLVFGLIGAATWVLLEPLLRGWADAGVGVAAVSGWIATAWLVWLGSELHLWPISGVTCSWLLIILVTIATLVAWSRRQSLAISLHRRRRGIAVTLITSALTFTLFALVRLFNPAVFWGEKPMDFSFLNAFLRADAWPPMEPWMAGQPLNYYYFGEVLAAVPMLMTDIPGRIGYNLMAATIPALAAAVLASLGLTLAGRRLMLGLALPGLVLLTGNLAWPFLLNLAHSGRWFDLWWATSRVIPGFAIDEYPLWTSVFADLHGHFVALPVVLAALAWAWQTSRARGRLWMFSAVICGLCAAVVAATNPWDLLLFSATLALATMTTSRRRLTTLTRLAVAAAFSCLLATPFLIELFAWMRSGGGGRGLFLNGADFAPAWAIFRHLGLFLIPLLILALTRLGRDLWIAVPLAIAGVAAGLSFGSQAAAIGLAAGAVFITAVGRESAGRARLIWTFAGLAMLTVAFCERVTLVDRMNTLFKLYNGIWLLLAAALTLALIESRGWRRTLLLATWLPLQIVAFVNLPLGLAQGIVQPRISSPRPSLDGQVFLRNHDRQTRFLSSTLNGMAQADDVVMEAAGDPYREFTRIAMHTGLATVVGWEHHLFQRGQERVEIRARFANVMAFYIGQDPALRRQLLDLYGADWVVIADVERNAYDVEDDAGLEQIPGLVLVGRQDGASLYRVLPSTEPQEG